MKYVKRLKVFQESLIENWTNNVNISVIFPLLEYFFGTPPLRPNVICIYYYYYYY